MSTTHGLPQRRKAFIDANLQKDCHNDYLRMAIGPEFRAGVSDANFIAQVGTPVTDGLGPQGGRDQSTDEYML